MKSKKINKIIATMGVASILSVGGLVGAKTTDYKDINLFSNAQISVVAAELGEHDNPYEVFDGDTLVNGYSTLSEAFTHSMSGNTIKIWQDFDAFETCVLSDGKNLILDGNNCTINNKNWGKTIFQVAAGSTLEIKNLKIDGGATTWKIDYENAYNDGNYARIPTKNYESEKKATASTIKSSGNLVASNLTIQNIFTTNGGDVYSGGVVGAGICVSAGTLQLVDCNFNHIAGGRGAAVDCNGALKTTAGSESTEYPITSVVVTGTTFDGNHACGRGAGINLRNVKEALFVNSTFKNNATTRNNGGGIMFDADTISKTISDNGTPDDTSDDVKITLTQDEYLGLPLPKLTVLNSIFEGNYCGNDGFAIENEGATSTIKHCKFLRNVGVNQISGSVGTLSYQVKHYGWVPQVLENCVFDGNKGATSGIGDHASNCLVEMKNIEFKNNAGATSVLIYNAQVKMEDVSFNNEKVRTSVIDARAYMDADKYSTSIDADGPSLVLKNTTFENTQGTDTDVVIRSLNSLEGKATFKVTLEGETKGNIQVSNNGELTIESTTHTGNIFVDPTGDINNVTVNKSTKIVGKIEETNTYMLVLTYYTAEDVNTTAKIYLPEGKVDIIDIQNLINEEKPGYVIRWYLANSYAEEWNYDLTNSIALYGKWVEHEHNSLSYVVENNAIYEGCECGFILENAKEISIVPPSNLTEDGKEKSVVVTNTLNIAESDYVVEYYKKTKTGYVLMGKAPTVAGKYKAVLKYNSFEANVEYNIESKQEEPFPVGVAVGCGAIVTIMIAAIAGFFIKRKNKKDK